MLRHNVWNLLVVLAVTPQGESYKFSCAPPNSCKTVQACSQGHNNGYLDNQVLFQCGRRYICCPPTQGDGVDAALYGNQGANTEEVTLQRIQTTTESWEEFPGTRTTVRSSTMRNRPQRTTESWPKPTSSWGEISRTTEKRRGYGTTETWQQHSSTWSGPQRTTQNMKTPSATPSWQKLPPVTEAYQKPPTTGHQFSPTRGHGWDDDDFYSKTTTVRPAVSPRPMSVNRNEDTFTSHRNWKVLPESCGLTLNNKIVAGQDAEVGEFPWMALIGFTGYNGRTGYVCGGTLISERYVLTAAHCLHKENAYLSHVRFGEFDLSKKEDCNGEDCFHPAVDIPVEKIIAHEEWNNQSYHNDIALVRLNSSALALGLATIFPICLPFNVSRLNLTNGYKYEAAGWGLTGWRESALSKVLQKTTLAGVSEESCNAGVCPEGRQQVFCPILPTQLCVQGTRKKDVCKGDSGGPLMTMKNIPTVQLGITSFKTTEVCGEDGIPSVFTRVDRYLKWILDHLQP